MKAKSSLVLVLASCLMSFPALAGQYEDAVKAHDAEDFKAAFSVFKTLAETDDSRAQFYLGHMYREGEGAKSSPKKAVKRLEKAVEQGDDNARALLGYMYWTGEGVRESASCG